MKIKILLGMLFSLAAMAVSGCGGGGGGTQPTIVSGTAMKGQFSSGTVKIFAVDLTTGAKAATPLKTDVLTATGTFSVDVSPHTGPIIVEVSGTYKDEATGLNATIADATPIRAAVVAAGSTPAMVTPLTELALKKAGAVLTAAVITKANADISTLFKVDNIVATKPVDATTAASATAAASEKNYSLALATVSQIMKSSSITLGQTLDGLAAEINTSASTPTMTTAASTTIKVAMSEFMESANNKTGVTDVATIPFSAATPKVALLKISTSGLAAGGTIGAIEFTMDLPATVSVGADATTKQVEDGAVVVSGVAATGTSISLATFDAQKLRTMLVNANGFGGGEFVTVGCDMASGSTVTAATLQSAVSSATITSATDLTGTPISGLTLTGTVKIF
ncbi:MAG: hypothetical protein HYV06_03295 [Deltaproteobacteria bacterium]|nr:hypothetical protein [Deltaproteobacteria bacterium]